MRRVTAADANRHFSRILRDVKAGESVTVTARGVEVAVIVPAVDAPVAARERARDSLLARLRAQPAAGATWTRDELYARGQP